MLVDRCCNTILITFLAQLLITRMVLSYEISEFGQKDADNVYPLDDRASSTNTLHHHHHHHPDHPDHSDHPNHNCQNHQHHQNHHYSSHNFQHHYHHPSTHSYPHHQSHHHSHPHPHGSSHTDPYPHPVPNPQHFNQSLRLEDQQLFYEDIDGYPQEEINRLLNEEGHKFSLYFGSDSLPVAMDNRMDIDWEDFCQSIEEIVYPKLHLCVQGTTNSNGMTNTNKWKYVVNVENAKQGVRIEKCRKNSSPCKYNDNLPNGRTSKCQTYSSQRNLLTFNAETKKFDLEPCILPTCCKCTLITN